MEYDLIVFIKCSGPNVRQDNITDTINSFIEKNTECNYSFYITVDESMEDIVKDIFEDKGYQVVFDNHWIIFTGDYLKWYEDYDDVKGVTEIIEELHETEDNAFMVALGESGEIHSEIGEWYNYIDCMRYLKIAK